MSNAAIDAIANSKASFAREYLAYGAKHRLEVQVIKTTDGDKGKFAHMEAKVLTTVPIPLPEGVPPKPVKTPGTVVSYSENLQNSQKGGGGRFKGMLMRLFGETDEAQMSIPRMRYINGNDVATGEILQNGGDQIGAFLLLDVEVKPKWLDGDPKRNLAGRWIDSQIWTSVEMTDAQIAEVEKKRAAAKLPSLRECLAKLASF